VNDANLSQIEDSFPNLQAHQPVPSHPVSRHFLTKFAWKVRWATASQHLAQMEKVKVVPGRYPSTSTNKKPFTESKGLWEEKHH